MIETLLEARASHRAVAPPSEREPLTLERAYGIQDTLRESLVNRGERVIGWKVGFTGRASQQMFGVDHPVGAFLLASGVYATGTAVPLARFTSLVVEVEIAFVMARDLAGPGVTPVAAGLAVEGALPALELVDFRFSGKPVATDVVADGVYANAVVLGQPLTRVAGLDLALEGVVYEQNGQVAATNTAAEVLGHPFNSLAWIANHLGARGGGLAAGDTVSARFTRLGSVSARFI